MSPIGLAVVGAGYWGPNLIRAARATPAFQLNWLCDRDLGRAQAALDRYTPVRATASYEQVLADPDVSAVAIATPAATHFDLVRAALEAGKHVLVEKPLTASVAEGVKLAELAERSGLVLMCDHTYCYTPVVQRIRELIRSGEIGDVQFVELGPGQPGPDPAGRGRALGPRPARPVDPGLRAARGRGAGSGGGPHGRPGQHRAGLPGLPVLWMSNGVLAHVNVNWLSPMKIRTTVIGGTRRTIVWDDMNPPARLMIHDRGVDRLPAETVAPDERRQTLISYRTGDTSIPALPEKEALHSVMAEFAGAITEGRAPLTDAWSGLRVLAALEAASRSAEQDGARIPVTTRVAEAMEASK